MKARSLFLFLFLGITFLAVAGNDLGQATAIAQQGTVITAEAALQALAYGRIIPTTSQPDTAATATEEPESPIKKPQEAGPPADLGGDIAFASNRSGPVYNLYTQNAAGGTAFNLTQSPAEDVAPSWTPHAPGECVGANMTLQPLLLAPSWDGADTIGEDTSGFRQMLPNLESNGYRLGCNLFYAGATAPDVSIYDNAARIREALCEAYGTVRSRRHDWNGHFDIIGHSFGGLRARAFLEDHRLYDQFGRDGARCEQLQAGEKLFVDNLFTLGSPHGGGDWNLPGAVLIGVTHLFQGHFVSISELLFAMPTYNETFSQAPNVCYWLVAGDAWQQAPVRDRFSWIHSISQETTPNDLGVYRWSAQAIADQDKYGDKYPNVVRVDTDDMHGYHWLFSDIYSYVFPENTFNAALRARIGGDMADCKAAQGINNTVGFAGNEPSTLAVPSRLLASGAVANGTAVSGNFQMDEGGTATLYLNWPAGDLDLTLTDPDGNLINPTMAQSDASVDYLEATIVADVTAYTVASAAAGTWNYTITAVDVPFTMPYKLVLVPARPIAVVAEATGWQPLGRPVTITGTVSYDETTLLAGATVQASISRPGGGTETIALFDDGLHNDGAAGDGIYGNVYPAADTAGYYLATVTAAATYQAQPYTRTAQATFTVAGNAALLANQYSDRPHDTNNDGFYEWLEVGADVAVNQAGAYTLAADLVAQDGRHVSHAVVQAALAAGARQMTLAFNGQDIAASGRDGPYVLTNVLLVDRENGTLLLDRAEDVYETAAYDHSHFGQPPAIYLPLLLR